MTGARLPQTHAGCIAALALGVLLGGCATPAPERSGPAPVSATAATLLRQFALTGRFSARTERDSASGQFRFGQDGQLRTMALFSPLGTPLGEIVATPQQVTLTLANGGVQTAASLAELLRTWVDVPLDDATLGAWLQGQPEPSLASDGIERDADGRPQRFAQAGWQMVVSERASEGRETGLPRRMRWSLLAQPDVEIRWVIDAWTLR